MWLGLWLRTGRPACCFTCVGCGMTSCGDQNPGPWEADDLCADCWAQEIPYDAEETA